MKKRRILFLVLAICLLASGCKKGKKDASEDGAAEHVALSEYVLDEDRVKSMSLALREDRIYTYDKYLNVTRPVAEGEEGETTDASAAETTDETTAETEAETEAETDTTAETEETESSADDAADGESEGEEEILADPDDDGSKKVIIGYQYQETASADALSYIKYLMEEEGFASQWEYNEEAPAGYVSLTRDSVEEGWVFQVDVDYAPRDYRIILTKWQKPEEPSAAEGEKNVRILSMEQAISYIRTFSPKALKIPEDIPMQDYSVMADAGRRPIGGMDYYVVKVYRNGENQTKSIVGTYYVGVNSGQILKYDLDTDSYTEIIYKPEPAAPVEAAAAQTAAVQTPQAIDDAESTETAAAN